MFETVVIIILALWSLIIFLFVGFASGIICILYLFSLTLSALAFMLIQLNGFMAGLPLFLYIFVLCVLAAIVTAAMHPSRIHYYFYKLNEIIRSRNLSRN